MQFFLRAVTLPCNILIKILKNCIGQLRNFNLTTVRNEDKLAVGLKVNWCIIPESHPDIFVSWRAVVAELLGTIIVSFIQALIAELVPVRVLGYHVGHACHSY